MRFVLRLSSHLHFVEWMYSNFRVAERLVRKLQHACTSLHQNVRSQRNPHPSQHPKLFRCSGRSITSRGRSFINSSATRSQSFACNTNIARHVSVGCSAYYTTVSTPKSTTTTTPTEMLRRLSWSHSRLNPLYMPSSSGCNSNLPFRLGGPCT